MSERLEKLERVIAGTPELKTEFAKKAMIWLLRKTDDLTHDAAVVVPGSNDNRGLIEQIVYGAHAVYSGTGTRHAIPFLNKEKIAFGSSWDEEGPQVFVFVNASAVEGGLGYGPRCDAAPHYDFNRQEIEAITLPEPL